MITHHNLKELLSTLNKKQLERIQKTNKCYIVLYCHVFNVGSFLTYRLTDNFNRYKNVSYNGNAILYTDEILYYVNAILNNFKTEGNN